MDPQIKFLKTNKNLSKFCGRVAALLFTLSGKRSNFDGLCGDLIKVQRVGLLNTFSVIFLMPENVQVRHVLKIIILAKAEKLPVLYNREKHEFQVFSNLF